MSVFKGDNTGQLESSVIWSAILVFGTALACFVCLRLTRSRIAARRREEALVIAAQRAQIDAEAASDAAAAAAEAGTATATGGGRGRRPSSSSAAAAAALAAAPRLSRTMIARLPTFNYVDPPAGQESDDDEAAGFVKGGDAERGNTAEEGEAASGGGATAAAAAATKPKKTFARSSSSGKRRCIVCLDPLSAEKVMALPCGHLFHSNCVGDWLERHATCPECRTEITSSLISALGDEDERFEIEGGGEGQQQGAGAAAAEVEGGAPRSHRRHGGRRHR